MRLLLGSVQRLGESAEVPNVFVLPLTVAVCRGIRARVRKVRQLVQDDPALQSVSYHLPDGCSWHALDTVERLIATAWRVVDERKLGRLSKELREQLAAGQGFQGVRGGKLVVYNDGILWFTAYEKYGGADFETSILYKDQQREFLGSPNTRKQLKA